MGIIRKRCWEGVKGVRGERGCLRRLASVGVVQGSMTGTRVDLGGGIFVCWYPSLQSHLKPSSVVGAVEELRNGGGGGGGRRKSESWYRLWWWCSVVGGGAS